MSLDRSDPAARFLGVALDADEFELLGLPPARYSVAEIEHAHRSQLERVGRHPDAGSDDARRVREALREAARRLKEQTRRAVGAEAGRAGEGRGSARRAGGYRRATTTTAPRELTSFDRAVLAVLISSGGWNASSRARLVELAASHGVAPEGLLKVIRGLGDHVGRAGGRIDAASITRGSARYDELPKAPAPSASREEVDRVAALLPELRRPGFWATAKLSVLFGAIALLLGVLFVRLLSRGTDPAPATPPSPGPAVVERPTQPDRVTGEDSGAVDAEGDRSPLAPPSVASFRGTPTFAVEIRPSEEAAEAVARAGDLAGEIERLEAKITVSSSLSTATRHLWEVVIGDAATSWRFLEPERAGRIREAVRQAFYGATDPTTADTLLDALKDLTGPPREPLDLARAAWAAGILAELAVDPHLPAVVREGARRITASFLPETADESVPAFARGARALLEERLDWLVAQTRGIEPPWEAWEIWLDVQERIGGASAPSRLRAIHALLRTDRPMPPDAPEIRIVGRLLEGVDWPSDAVERDLFLGVLQDEGVPAGNAWLLTSLLARTGPAWFTESMVIPREASREERLALRALVRDAWPLRVDEPGRRREAGVDPALASRWDALFQAYEARREATGERTLIEPRRLARELELGARLNTAAAAIWAGDADAADVALSETEDALAPEDASEEPAMPPGVVHPGGSSGGATPGVGGTNPQPGLGDDGQWGLRFQAAEDDHQERLKLLRWLRTAGVADLGPKDAEVLVRTAFHGSPGDVRELAQTITLERFRDGPQVALALVHGVVDAPRTGLTSDFVERVTGASLPHVRVETWSIDARRVLLEHTLKLRPVGDDSLDRIASEIDDLYRRQIRLLEPPGANGDGVEAEETAEARAADPADAAAMLTARWRERALDRAKGDDPSAGLVGVDRRQTLRLQLARGSLQEFVARQAGVLEYAALAVAEEEPSLAAALDAVRRDAELGRRDAEHVLQQAVRTEFALARLWRIRLAPPTTDPPSGGEPS